MIIAVEVHLVALPLERPEAIDECGVIRERSLAVKIGDDEERGGDARRVAHLQRDFDLSLPRG
jgi:hypothetical protein